MGAIAELRAGRPPYRPDATARVPSNGAAVRAMADVRSSLVRLSAIALSLSLSVFSRAAIGGVEFAASFEVRPGAIVEGAPMGFGFSMNAEPRYAEGPLRFEIAAGPVRIGPDKLVSGFDTCFRTGLWHHVAVAYRQDGNTAHVWVDGDLMGVGHTETRSPPPARAFLDAPKANADFPGEIRNVRTWTRIPDEAELLPKGVIDPIRKAALAFEARLAGGFDGQEPASGVLPLSVDRFSREKHVPFRMPSDAKVLKGIRIAAAQGEIDDASFLLFPFRDFGDVDLRVSDLTGPDGTIDAGAFDVRLVKCWLQCRGGWCNFYTQGQHYPTLTPELLVHDDALLSVDPKTHRNMLRVSYPDGETFVSVSTPEDPKTCAGFNFNLEPVRDARSLVPFALAAGRSRQLWLTFRCPENAKGGDYRGTVTVRAGGETLCEIPLAVKVHPFRLPLPHCRYAPELPFLATWMWHGNLPDKLNGYGGGGFNLEKAQRRLYAELRNLAEHNCGYPWALLPPPSATGALDFASMQLDLMKRAGCEMRPLFGGIGAGGDLAYRASSDKSVLDMSVPENRHAFEREMAAFTNRLERQIRFVESKVGHREIVYYALDEAPPPYIRRTFPSFAALNHFGGHSFTTSGDASSAAFMTDFNDMAGAFDLVKGTCSYNLGQIRKWHASGARVFSYGSPHSGPECPDIWRREKGLGAYFANLDGVNEYIWYEAAHIWNDFVYDSGYRNFCMVYPTADGVLDTVQWEAEREGLDDIRYFSYLDRLAQAAIASGKGALVAQGRKAVQWIELADWHGGDLDELRLGAAERIVSLRESLFEAGVGELPGIDYPSKPQPFVLALPSPPAGATADELSALAEGYAKAGACDVAARFYAAAAEREAEKGRSAKYWTLAGDCALQYRDRIAAADCYEKGGARVKKAMMAFQSGEIGWKPDSNELARVENLVWSQGDGEARLAFLRAVVASGDEERGRKLAMSLHESAKGRELGGLRTQSAGIAADLWCKLGDNRQASHWYELASADEWPPCSKMMYRAAECADAAGSYTRAIDCYSKVMRNLNRREQGAAYEKMRKRVEELSKKVRQASGVPNAAGFDSATGAEVLSLDEE